MKQERTIPKAYENFEFLNGTDARSLRILSEYLEPESRFKRYRVNDTIVFMGSARAVGEDTADARRRQGADAGSTPQAALAPYYEAARELAGRLTEWSKSLEGDDRRFVICSGGGPGIMEAANRGAFDVGAKSIGLNITLPFEQEPNSYITPELCFEFKYFAVRKMHFLMRAKAMVAFPGGFGTMDELFETLTLIQTKRMEPIPVILFGKDYWSRLVNWDLFVEEGTISPRDLELISYAETAAECWQIINEFYRIKPAEKLPRGQ